MVAPGHPLLAAVVDLVEERHRHVLTQGALLVDDADDGETLRVMVMLEHAIADGRPATSSPHTVVSRRFEFVEVPEHGHPRTIPGAPYLDYRAVIAEEASLLSSTAADSWVHGDVEALGRDHAIEVAVPEHLAAVRLETLTRVERTGLRSAIA
jgi:hypothetical protein